MNKNDKSTIVLGHIALLAVLAMTTPAPAMNDPVTGRWITRDTLPYNTSSLHPNGLVAVTLANRPGIMSTLESAPRLAYENSRLWPMIPATDQGPRWSGRVGLVGLSMDGATSLYESLRSQPAFLNDPSGLEPWYAYVSCTCLPTLVNGCSASGVTCTMSWVPIDPYQFLGSPCLCVWSCMPVSCIGTCSCQALLWGGPTAWPCPAPTMPQFHINFGTIYMNPATRVKDCNCANPNTYQCPCLPWFAQLPNWPPGVPPP
jgi:hypothetical protein